jgi:diguanylate cyclase (GGDEF)-like protein
VSSRAFTILAADDSPIYSTLIERALRHDYPELIFAKDGREALSLFEQFRPDLVITDWVMPTISGPELCQQIRNISGNAYTYLMLLTSNSEKDGVVAGLAAGADDYLIKPFDSRELVARVGVGRRIIELQREVQAKNRLLEEMALTDSLTGLPNRRAIEFWAPQQLSSAVRHGYPLWIAIADLDLFKQVNDTFGHAAGDVVLQGFSRILRENMRSSNICGRIGGEEFLLILTHADGEGARLVLERIRKELEEHAFVYSDNLIRVTTSFGIAGLDKSQPCEFDKLVANADVALYKAKQKGRNCIEFHRA